MSEEPLRKAAAAAFVSMEPSLTTSEFAARGNLWPATRFKAIYLINSISSTSTWMTISLSLPNTSRRIFPVSEYGRHQGYQHTDQYVHVLRNKKKRVIEFYTPSKLPIAHHHYERQIKSRRPKQHRPPLQ